ncbi:MAG: hypothetical protein ABR585_07840 [Gemmatimonadaceae bacterium]
MAAIIRSCVTTAIHSGSRDAFRGASEAGDVLLAFHSSDAGTLENMGLGPGWELIGYAVGGIWAGTQVMTRVTEAGEAHSYDVAQSGTADGVVTIMAIRGADPAGIVVESDTGTISPIAFPVAASGVDIRYAAGVPQVSTSISWSAPSGYLQQTSGQSSGWTTSCVATRSVSSSAPVGTAAFSPSSALHVSHAFTVIVASSATTGPGSGGPPPTPPTYPSFTPGRGTALYQYIFRRLLDGQFLGSLDLADVHFDKRILQPGSFSAKIPIPNPEVADIVSAIIPRDPSVLTTGPGVIVCDIWRGGIPWGEYWITGASISRSGRDTPSIALRGSTLDAYLLHVELQEDLEYTSTDQVTIARNLIAHMQAQAGANIGLTLKTGLTSVPRDQTYAATDGGTYGQRLVELAQLDGGFEWAINVGVSGGAIERQWVWGYPTLGDGTIRHVFSDGANGGDILQWSEDIDALRGATRWRARGGSQGGDASVSSTPLISTVHEAAAHLTAGWPRLDRTVNRSTVTDPETLEDWAAYWVATAPGALRVDSITVALGANPTFTPDSLGDTARLFLSNEWHLPHSRTRRIIGVGITPTSKTSGKEEAQLILEGQQVDG